MSPTRSLVGVDCGGTTTKLLLLRDGPDGLHEQRSEICPTPTGAGGMAALRRLVDDFRAGTVVTGLGVSVPGVVNADEVVSACVNIPWLVGRSVASELLPEAPRTATINDGVAAATAETGIGAARDYSDVFMYTLGTGIAGAHIVDGVIRRGAHGAAYEIGHVATGSGDLCACGQRGCLETVLGGTSLGRRWDRLRGEDAGSQALDVTRAARAGDSAAVSIIDDATTALGRSMLTVLTLLDPQVILVGGGLAGSMDLILDPAVAKLRRFATFQAIPPVIPAATGLWAGAWGAALAASASPAPERS